MAREINKLKSMGKSKTYGDNIMKKLYFCLMFLFISFIVYSQQTTGIKVTTSIGGALSLNGREISNLWDNDSYTIPIETPGTYQVKIKLANGKEITKTVVISSRGIVDLNFLMPPVNFRIGTVGVDNLQLLWDTSGTGTTYNIYYNTVNHVDSAKVERNINDTSKILNSLEWNKTYYVWISVTENTMEGVKSSVISQALLETRLGQTGPGGGIIFYDKGVFNEGWRYLEAAPSNTDFTATWGGYSNQKLYGWPAEHYTVEGTSTAIGTGKSNTDLIIARLRQLGENNRAAQLCTSLNINGFTDWFLPSKDELNYMFINIKQKGWGNFKNEIYWSSSQIKEFSAWCQSFSGGMLYNDGVICFKSNSYYVRAVRAF